MKIGFVVNDIASEKAEYTTTRLALTAARRGHETWLMGVGDFTQQPDGTVIAHGASVASKRHRTETGYLKAIQGHDPLQPVSVDDLDILMMRNDPAEDQVERPWAVTSAILFAQLSAARGTLVLNDPASLANAVNKTYFQHFPEDVRPRTRDLPGPGRAHRVHRRPRRMRRAEAPAGFGRRRCLLRVRR